MLRIKGPGYVYAMEKEPFQTKIGFSKYTPKERCKSLIKKEKMNLQLKGYIYLEDAYHHEQHIHARLTPFRIKTEWYNLSYEEIKNLLIDEYDFIDGIPPDSHDKRHFLKPILLKIPLNWLEKIDKSVEERYGMTRTTWLLQAAQEKIEREND